MESVRKIIQTYLTHSPTLLTALRVAVTQSDALAIRQAAHNLKSSSGHVGATTLMQLCKELESMGQAGTLSDAEAMVVRIEAEYDLVRQALSQEISATSV